MLPYICRIWFILIMGYRIVDSGQTTIFTQNDSNRKTKTITPYGRTKQTEDTTITFPATGSTIYYTLIKTKLVSVSQGGQTTIFNQNDSTREANTITPYDRTKQTEDTTNAFPKTESIIYTVIKNKFGSVSQAGQTTTFNQNDSIQHSTNITTYGSTTQTDVCIKITAGVAAFLGSIIVILSVVISILRRKLRKAPYTCLTVRRDRNIYNETTHHLPAPGHYLEITPLDEMSASGYRPTEQQLIDQIQHVDTSGYLIPSSSFQRNEDQYESI